MLWSASGFEGHGSGPIAVGDLVLAMSDESSKSLVALDAETGEEHWRVERGRRLSLPAAPAYASGLVFVTGREPDGDRRPLVLAVDIGTGQGVWQAPLDGGTRVDEWLLPLATGGSVYVASTIGICASFDVSTGQEQWRADVANVKTAPPASAGDIIVFITADGLIALDTSTGEERWRSEVAGAEYVAAADGVLYMVGSGASQYELPVLHALDLATGAEKWSIKGVEGVPAIAEGKIYIGGGDGFLALDAGTGAEIWRIDAHLARAPTIVDDVIFTPDEIDFFAFDAATGATIWSVLGWGDAIDSSHATGGPAVLGGRIFFYAEGGFLAALGD